MSNNSARTAVSGMGVEFLSVVRALIAAWFPSAVGMFVYMLVTSTVQRIMSLQNVCFSKVWMRCVVSLMYVGKRTTACFSQKSKKPDMLAVMLLTQEHIGLYVCGFLCSLMRKYIKLVLCDSGG